ncbi:hypothetical protein CQW23_03678 [Capsicum baccatum]|uniref:Uncharacterized protein n=1 Tax=Capsicum baccatum TaxID=33114 RepID=A0A2G2XCF9_CAPBA|nr:hypothetical protein CQW23_03678 [Capsicum baccatum]
MLVACLTHASQMENTGNGVSSAGLDGKSTVMDPKKEITIGTGTATRLPPVNLTHRLQAPACWKNKRLELDRWKLAFPLDISQWLKGLTLALLLLELQLTRELKWKKTSTSRKPYYWKKTARLAVNGINPPCFSLWHNWISIRNERRSGGTHGTTYWITPVRNEAADADSAPIPLAMPCLVPWWTFRSMS